MTNQWRANTYMVTFYTAKCKLTDDDLQRLKSKFM